MLLEPLRGDAPVPRRAIVAGLAAAPFAGASGRAAGATASDHTGTGAVTAPTGFPAPVTAIPTGAHSHWLQPWRTMLAPRPFAAVAGGLGIQNNDLDHPESLALFAATGFRHVRIGMNWSFVGFDDPDRIADGAAVAPTVRFVAAARRAGLRPLVLLQAFSQAPCPSRSATIVLTRDAAEGDRTIALASTAGLLPGRSGPTAWWVTGGSVFVPNFIDRSGRMCPVLFTEFAGNEAQLSRPLPVAIPAGSRLVVNTLRYAPFAPGTAEYATSLDGWRRYVGAVARFMAGLLGTAGAADRGFDLEVWNEVTFGSEFLDINNYYAPPRAAPVQRDGVPAISIDLVDATAEAVRAAPSLFRGVGVSNGFGSVTPQPAASRQPAGITAISKHPYPTPQRFPDADRGGGGLDRFGHPTGFVPRYTMYAHEYFSTAINPFTLARDIARTPNDFGGVMHGQDARAGDPVGVWMTEIGTAANVVGVGAPDARWQLLGKGTLRAWLFNVGIGVERVYLFRGVGALDFFALVPAERPTVATPPLLAIRRVLAFMRGAGTVEPGAVEPAPTGAPPITATLVALGGGSPETLFQGDGTPNCPDMRRGDDHVLFPVPIRSGRVALVHWFIGTDMRDEVKPRTVTLRVAGLGAAMPRRATALDPLSGQSVPATLASSPDGTLRVETEATDAPRIVVLDQ